MTNQEAIEELKRNIEMPFGSDVSNEASEFAIHALEKQIPKIPDVYGDGYSDGQLVYDMYACPNCGENYEIDYDHYEYCPKCGQHMDESDFVECDMEKIAPENCGIIKRNGKPETDSNGRCMGFGKSETDDEPCEQCKKCKHYTSYEED